jgi:hypothetical protein
LNIDLKIDPRTGHVMTGRNQVASQSRWSVVPQGVHPSRRTAHSRGSGHPPEGRTP